MKKILILLWSLLLVITFASCEYLNSTQNEEEPIVQVYEDFLYMSDLENIIPQNMSEKDSIRYMESHIKNWIIKSLLVQNANKNHSFDEAKLDKKIEEYKNSLIIYEFQKNYLKQVQDTTFTSKEIIDYYDKHKEEFTLSEDYFKANFIYVNKESQYLNDVWRFYKREDSISKNKLSEVCQKLTTQHSLEHKWYTLNEISQIIPKKDIDPIKHFKYTKNLQSSDSDNFFFMTITEFRLVNDTAPLEVVEDKIKKILIHKKRNDKMKQLEEKLYNNAYSSNNIKYY